MSGHSKWSQIKRQKGIADQKRGLVFSKLSKIITLAVIEGGGIVNPDNNVKLRMAIDRAKAANMPKANIERAIEHGDRGESSNLREVVYEGFALANIGLVITGTTDNPNRTFNLVKSTLEKCGGKIGNTNSVLYLFDKCGVVVFAKENSDEVKVFAFADSIKSIDIEEEDNSFIVYIPFEQLGHINNYLDGLQMSTSDIFYRPKAHLQVSPNEAKIISNIIEKIEDLEDIDKVYSNYEIAE